MKSWIKTNTLYLIYLLTGYNYSPFIPKRLNGGAFGLFFRKMPSPSVADPAGVYGYVAVVMVGTTTYQFTKAV